MEKIYIIDNGGQWTHREWRTLKYIGVDTKIVPNTTLLQDLLDENIDGLVLSGGTPRIGLEDTLGNCDEYFQKATFPILGICAGHQYMATFYGGKVSPSTIPEFGNVELTILEPADPLFTNIPTTSTVWESHNDEVSELPKDFIHLAKSDNCLVQAMRHKHKPFYGLQFHPEVEHSTYGKDMFTNFVEICEKMVQ